MTAGSDLLADEKYFLSKDNPAATLDQRDCEARAMRLMKTKVLKEARNKAAFLWRLAYGEQGASDEAWALFDDAMTEYAFNYLLKAVNSDPNHPKIVQNFLPAHQWFGKKVTGARIGGDNPDNIYRMIPIAHGARYALHGRRASIPPSSVTFTLVGNYGTSKTIMSLDAANLDVAPDGSFLITIDDTPAGARRNHLTTAPGCKILFIRDSLSDWTSETPNWLRIKRLTPPDAPPLTDEEIAARAAEIMTDDVPLYYWFTRLCSAKPVNTLPKPVHSRTLGGLEKQIGLQGQFKLADDEAALVTYNPAGAAYSSFTAQDWWFRTIDYWRVQSSLTQAAMKPNADGTITLVMSLEDPGVHNWIDTGGLHEILVVVRWQGLPDDEVRGGPSIATKVVKLAELPGLLPKETVMVTPAERTRQLAIRQVAYNRRLVDK